MGIEQEEEEEGGLLLSSFPRHNVMPEKQGGESEWVVMEEVGGALAV